MPDNHKKIRVLIINCYLDETRRLKGRPHFVPQGLGPAYLAGAFKKDMTDITLYSEFHSGPLLDEKLLGWPDIVVLTGMTTAFDRMRHLSAYVRTKNPKVIVVAGGQAIRALPIKSQEFFDYVCLGDVEELQEVVRDAFGQQYVEDTMYPRYDLINWMGFIGYVESSLNCNFKCSFCTLSGEGNSYKTYDLDHLARQIEAVGWRTCMLFLDNNFYGNNLDYFYAKLDLLKTYWKKKSFGGWAALVTNDFFSREINMQRAKESGCLALFCGVESFSANQLKRFRKKQNLITPQVESIRNCLDNGIVFQYGVILDTSKRRLTEIKDELEFITTTPEITLPAFTNLTIPILRTPYFYECLHENSILPNTKLRDMDGNTLVLRSLDPIEDVVQFLKEMPTLHGYKKNVLKHTMGFYRRYRKKLTTPQMISAIGNGMLLCLPALAHNHSGIFKREHMKSPPRTYVTGTEPVGPLYEPFFPSPLDIAIISNPPWLPMRMVSCMNNCRKTLRHLKKSCE